MSLVRFFSSMVNPLRYFCGSKADPATGIFYEYFNIN